VVDQSVQEYLTEYLELHPDILDLILSKSLNALKVSCCGSKHYFDSVAILLVKTLLLSMSTIYIS